MGPYQYPGLERVSYGIAVLVFFKYRVNTPNMEYSRILLFISLLVNMQIFIIPWPEVIYSEGQNCIVFLLGTWLEFE